MKKETEKKQNVATPAGVRRPTGYWLDLLAKVGVAALAVYAAYYIWSLIGQALFPVVTALFLAYLLSPILGWLRSKGLPKPVALLVLYLFLIVTFSGIILILVPIINREIVRIVDRIPIIVDTIQTRVIPFLRDQLDMELPANFSEALANYSGDIKSALPGVLKKGGGWVVIALGQTSGILSGLMNIVLIPIFMLFFLIDMDSYRNFLIDLFPLKRRDTFLAFFGRIDEVLGSWFRGQLRLTFILSMLYGTGMAIVFGLSGFGTLIGFSLGALTGILNIVPYIGVSLGLSLSIAVALIEWNGILPVVATVAAFSLVQVTDAYFITPRIVGKKVGLSTPAVLIALLLGGALAGLLGMLLAIPTAAIARVIWPDLRDLYKRSRYYQGDSSEM